MIKLRSTTRHLEAVTTQLSVRHASAIHFQAPPLIKAIQWRWFNGHSFSFGGDEYDHRNGVPRRSTYYTVLDVP
jgi:hypothetical protein